MSALPSVRCQGLSRPATTQSPCTLEDRLPAPHR
uniref:Uncharacterized protein n=1 Tax=Anguilla anguilla TaxID=7936 RepID=A0A0E9S4D7_ANGAN